MQCCELPDLWSITFLALGSGREKIRIRDPRSGINISDHISESSVTDQGLRNLDSGSGMKKWRSGIRDTHPGFASLLIWPSTLRFLKLLLREESQARNFFAGLQVFVTCSKFYKILLTKITIQSWTRFRPYFFTFIFIAFCHRLHLFEFLVRFCSRVYK